MKKDKQGFEINTKAIRVSYKAVRGDIRQSRVFFPSPTLEDALKEAIEFASAQWSSSITEAKRVSV